MVDLTFLRERKKILLLLGGIIIFLIALLGGRLFFEWRADDSAPNDNSLARSIEDLISPPIISDEILPEKKISPLTGLEIGDKTAVKSIAVMIENLPASRPQMRGLDEAGIVVEALAEGGITRFLAIFDTSDLKKVGPVRSARPYFVEWAEEFGGAFVHAGGSPDGLAELAESNLTNFDEEENSEILFRDFQFLAPHNLFVNLAEIRKMNFASELPENWFDFDGNLPTSATDARNFSLDFSLPSYFVEYFYDAADGKYNRKVGGQIHSAGGTAIRPTNIVVQFTEYFPIDDEGRLELRTTGEGAAWFFSEGKFWRGTWKKVGDRTQFFGSAGNPVSFNPGQTFIEILDATARVAISSTDLEIK